MKIAFYYKKKRNNGQPNTFSCITIDIYQIHVTFGLAFTIY